MKAKAKPAMPTPQWTARTHAEIAEFLGCSVSTVAYYRKQGMPLANKGPHDLQAVVGWLDARRLRERCQDQDLVAELLAARAQLAGLASAAQCEPEENDKSATRSHTNRQSHQPDQESPP